MFTSLKGIDAFDKDKDIDKNNNFSVAEVLSSDSIYSMLIWTVRCGS